MEKVGRSLDLVEEWPTVDPEDLQAICHEGRKLRFLISLLVKARDRDQQTQLDKVDRENQRIRRKTGLAA